MQLGSGGYGIAHGCGGGKKNLHKAEHGLVRGHACAHPSGHGLTHYPPPNESPTAFEPEHFSGGRVNDRDTDNQY